MFIDLSFDRALKLQLMLRGSDLLSLFSFLHASSTDFKPCYPAPTIALKIKKYLIGSSLGFWSRSQFINVILYVTPKSQVPKVPKQH